MQPQLLCVEASCDYCGATLEVTAAEIGGEPRPHPYLCPQCGKNYELTCTGNPHVRVLQPRKDGRTSSYQQTMF